MVYFYHNDHLATPQKMTDSSGAVVWSADYKPFGEATVTVSTITNNLRFPGQYYDAETGLNYNYFRDYNPALGRYVEGDPSVSRRERIISTFIRQIIRVNATDPTGLRTFRCRALIACIRRLRHTVRTDIPGNPLYHEYLCVYNSGSAACGGARSVGWSMEPRSTGAAIRLTPIDVIK